MSSAPSRASSEAATHLAGVAYALPGHAASLEELERRGLLESRRELLAGFGFERVHLATSESPYELALTAAGRVLEQTGTAPDAVDLLVMGCAPGAGAFHPDPSPEAWLAGQRTVARFRTPGARLQHELGLERAMVLGVDQLACTTLFGAVRVARALCLTEGVERALCVVGDVHPPGGGREALYNCTSDAGAAVLVRRGAGPNRIRAQVQVTRGFYWDPEAHPNEMVAAYFPTARHVMERVVAEAGWAPEQVDWVIPHNVSLRSWQVLLGLVRLPRARLWDRNIARVGHTLAGDNFVNLADALDAGDVERGHRLVLFSFGYGAHWTALALEA